MQMAFNFDESRNRRDAALLQVDENAADAWKETALAVVHSVARRKSLFTTDDVWAEMPDEATTHERRAMGPIMRRAQRNAWIEPTGNFRATARVQGHASPKRIWRSLINDQGA